MKKQDKRWTTRLGALALSAALLGTAAALAAGGDQNDPLITLSYLNQTVIPQIVRQVEEKTAETQKELEHSFAQQVEQYKREAGQGSDVSGSACFSEWVRPPSRRMAAPPSLICPAVERSTVVRL